MRARRVLGEGSALVSYGKSHENRASTAHALVFCALRNGCTTGAPGSKWKKSCRPLPGRRAGRRLYERPKSTFVMTWVEWERLVELYICCKSMFDNALWVLRRIMMLYVGAHYDACTQRGATS